MWPACGRISLFFVLASHQKAGEITAQEEETADQTGTTSGHCRRLRGRVSPSARWIQWAL